MTEQRSNARKTGFKILKAGTGRNKRGHTETVVDDKRSSEVSRRSKMVLSNEQMVDIVSRIKEIYGIYPLQC